MSTDHIPNQNDELVMVPVPRHLLMRVYAFIAENSHPGVDHERSGEPPSNDERLPRVSGFDWTVDDFLNLRRDNRPSSGRIVKVLDVLSAAPDSEFSTTRLAEAVGLTKGELSGGFSGFSRVCKNLRPGVALDWPIQWNYGPSSTGGQSGETYYWLPAALGERWKESGS